MAGFGRGNCQRTDDLSRWDLRSLEKFRSTKIGSIEAKTSRQIARRSSNQKIEIRFRIKSQLRVDWGNKVRPRAIINVDRVGEIDDAKIKETHPIINSLSKSWRELEIKIKMFYVQKQSGYGGKQQKSRRRQSSDLHTCSKPNRSPHRYMRSIKVQHHDWWQQSKTNKSFSLLLGELVATSFAAEPVAAGIMSSALNHQRTNFSSRKIFFDMQKPCVTPVDVFPSR